MLLSIFIHHVLYSHQLLLSGLFYCCCLIYYLWWKPPQVRHFSVIIKHCCEYVITLYWDITILHICTSFKPHTHTHFLGQRLIAPLQCNCRKVPFLSLSVSSSLFSPYFWNINEKCAQIFSICFLSVFSDYSAERVSVNRTTENNEGFCLHVQFPKFLTSFKLKYWETNPSSSLQRSFSLSKQLYKWCSNYEA